MSRSVIAALGALALSGCAGVETPPVTVETPGPAQSGEPARASFMPADLTPAGVRAADDHLALEEVEGETAMAFVRAANARSEPTLTADPRYETWRREAFEILSSDARLPSPGFLGDGVGNFWQDARNPKGVWRRTSIDSFRSAKPDWDVLLDIDALARTEGRDWVWKGANCLAPDDRRCLVSLSEGGKDALVVREFDTAAKAFVEGGFVLPEGKHRLDWLDRDTLLVATDFGAGTLTESGYPYIIRALKRGQTLDQAREVFRGEAGDGGYGVNVSTEVDAAGRVQAVIIRRPLDTFRAETWVLGSDGAPHRLNLPERADVHGMIDGRLVFTANEPWTFDGETYAAGSLLAPPIARLGQERDAARTGRGEALLLEPTERQSIEEVRVLGSQVAATVYTNVSGGIMTFTPTNGTWRRGAVGSIDRVSMHLGAASKAGDRYFFTSEGFLTPRTLSLVDARTGNGDIVRQAPAQFDASRHVVEQFEATSSDGTKIPYFVVRPRDLAMEGTAPTLLFGYGGFQVSKPPAYMPEMGKLWLEKGGVFVNANIRGGGEFGPEWHQSVLKQNRQLSFDDFAAVARDLADRGITSPRRLGIYGRSNGGVLTSVMLTQHPELINAAVIESPLIDMLRYHELPAGASWIGEYGDPRIPAEAAFIARYSAYQNLRPGQAYPRAYITTNTRDDRVHPGHARKFAARLEDLGQDHLYFEQTAGGHSNDADPVANARRWARHYVYLAQQLMD